MIRITFSSWIDQVCAYLDIPASDKESLETNEWWIEQFKQGATVRVACGKYLFKRRLP